MVGVNEVASMVGVRRLYVRLDIEKQMFSTVSSMLLNCSTVVIQCRAGAALISESRRNCSIDILADMCTKGDWK